MSLDAWVAINGVSLDSKRKNVTDFVVWVLKFVALANSC